MRKVIKATLMLQLLLMLACITPCMAQQGPQGHQHQLNNTRELKGSNNPDNIPDVLAKQLILEQFQRNPKDVADSDRRAAFLHKIGLNEQDSRIFLNGVDYFGAGYAAYNRDQHEAAAKHDFEGAYYDRNAFEKRLNKLVETAWSAIEASVSEDGASLLAAYVKSEKKGMTLEIGGDL